MSNNHSEYEWDQPEQNDPTPIYNFPEINENFIDPLENISPEILSELHTNINQSIIMADEILIKKRPFELLNRKILFNNHEIDMYDYLITNDNLLPGEYSLIAYANDYDMWFSRKTNDNILQYYHATFDDSYDIPPNFIYSLFIKGYKERLYP